MKEQNQAVDLGPVGRLLRWAYLIELRLKKGARSVHVEKEELLISLFIGIIFLVPEHA